MNFATLFSLQAPDLIIILLIVLLLFGAKKWRNSTRGMGEAMQRFMEARGRWMGSSPEPEKDEESPIVALNRLLVPIAIVIFLLACGIWVFGQSN